MIIGLMRSIQLYKVQMKGEKVILSIINVRNNLLYSKSKINTKSKFQHQDTCISRDEK